MPGSRLVYRIQPQELCGSKKVSSPRREAGFRVRTSGRAVGRLFFTLLTMALPGLSQAPPRTAPSIVTASALPPALTGSPYSQTLAVSGTPPITWSVSSGALPSGLALNKFTGAMSGTPTASGVTAFTVRATNAFGSSSKQLSLTVNGPPAILTSSPLPAGLVGTPYLQTLAVSGSPPTSWALTSGALPAGMAMNTSVGVIGGTPTAQGMATFTLTAANAYGSSSAVLTLMVNAAPSIVTTSPLTTALSGTAYSQTLTASGSTPIRWAVASGALPTGLTLNAASGVISGTPAAAGTATFTVAATNAFGNGSEPLSLTVNSPVSVQVAPTTATLTAGQTVSLAPTVTGSTNTGVVWWLSPATGTISASGLYTAPALIASAQNVTATATSKADSSKSGSVVISLAPVTVSVSPSTTSLTISQTQQLTATVTGSSNTAVTWGLSPPVGTISSTGLYTAPASIASAQNVSVTASSVVDPTKSASATLSLVPVAVTLSPPTVSLLPSQNQTFTAGVSGTSNGGVTWSLSPNLGSLASTSTTAVYVASSTAPTTQSVTITAASVADSSKTATAVITLPQTVTVSVGPSTVSLGPSGTQQFTATVLGSGNTAVTWSISPSVGTISSAGLYTAPTSVTTAQTVTVTAKSVADGTKLASGVVLLEIASFNVKSFGARGDGVTNDKAAFDSAFAAIKLAGAGSLYVPAGQYVYDNSSSAFYDSQTFTDEASNVDVFGDGSTISVINFKGIKGLYLGLGHEDINRYCTAPPSTGCDNNFLAYPLPTYYLMNDASGGSSITLKVPAQASNFTAGGVVFMESGDASPGTGDPPVHFEFNTVVSANSTTGVIVLQNSLTDSYDSGQPPYVPMIAQISVVPANIVIRNIGFTTSQDQAAIISFSGTENAVIENCAFSALGGTESYIWENYSWHATITHSTFSGVSSDLGDAGAYFSFTNNVVQNAPNGINGHGSGRQWLFDGNQVTVLDSCPVNCTVFNITGSATSNMTGLQISNNSIGIPKAAYPSGIAVGYVSGAIIEGNTFNGTAMLANAGSAVSLYSDDISINTQIYQNVVNSPNLAFGIHVSGSSGAAIYQNTFTSTGIGINVDTGATGTNLGCNTFFTNGKNTSDKGSGTMYTCGH